MLLAVAGGFVALVVSAVRAWRNRPSRLATARRLDDALGLAEVVASGFAFERDGRTDEMARFAVERARRAVNGIAIDRLLVFEPRPRSKLEMRWLSGAGAALVLGLGLGTVDRVAIDRL
ncbi:MAG: TolA protein, partial [Labilithrix sp.]|nr:TolA protein [Labilithrix sp.]